MFYLFFKMLFYIPIKLLFPVKIIGKENLIKDEGSILAINHTSNLDAAVLGINLPIKINFLGKQELFKSKLGNWFYTKMGVIKVFRGKADLNAVRTILRRLKKGKAIGIFPSGTRNQAPEEVNDLKNGTALFAIKGHAFIVPIVFLKRHRLFRRNKMVIGTPFKLVQPKERLDKEFLENQTKKITNNMERLLI